MFSNADDLMYFIPLLLRYKEPTADVPLNIGPSKLVIELSFRYLKYIYNIYKKRLPTQ